MGDLLETAAGWLDGMRRAHLSRTVTYCRGEESAEVAATVGKTEFDIDDGYGAVERFVSRDFLIAGAALVLGGEAVEPRPGDKIEETAGGVVHVHEVLAPGKEPCWRWSDPYRTTLRIHTKETALDVPQ